jgi:hypothetical protein
MKQVNSPIKMPLKVMSNLGTLWRRCLQRHVSRFYFLLHKKGKTLKITYLRYTRLLLKEAKTKTQSKTKRIRPRIT